MSKGESMPGGVAGQQPAPSRVPEAGVYRIELLSSAMASAAMLITVRTPETQLDYRVQAILEGDPWPMELAFLESPPTNSGDYDLDEIEWQGPSCTGKLAEDKPGGKPGAYEAPIDEQTDFADTLPKAVFYGD